MRSALLPLVFLAAAACGAPGDSDPGAAADEPGGVPSARPAPDSLPTGPDSLPAGEERVRVVFLGTSLTAGLGLVDPDARFTARIQALADSAGLAVEVVNAGVSGDTSAGGLARLDWLLESPVDVLFVELGANDGLRGQDPATLEENLLEIIERARARHPEVRIVLAGMQAPPNLGRRYTDRFQEVFPTVAEETGAALVPFLLEGVAGDPALNQGDGIHPTARGHEVIAHTVWPVLEPVLRNEGRGAGGDP